MWSRCWWATWVSGFFGIFGALHLFRAVVGFRLVVGSVEVSRVMSAAVGVVLLGISAGFLLIEVQRARARRQCSKSAS